MSLAFSSLFDFNMIQFICTVNRVFRGYKSKQLAFSASCLKGINNLCFPSPEEKQICCPDRFNLEQFGYFVNQNESEFFYIKIDLILQKSFLFFPNT